jgi:hypothetical protein
MIIFLLIQMVVWGWVFAGSFGILLLLLSFIKRMPRQIILAICIISFSALWARLVQPYTWGIACQTIQTQSPELKATVIQQESYYLLRIFVNDEIRLNVSLGRRPVHIFWLQEGITIGIVQQNNPRRVLDISLYNSDGNLHPGKYLRPPTSDENKYFDSLESK